MNTDNPGVFATDIQLIHLEMCRFSGSYRHGNRPRTQANYLTDVGEPAQRAAGPSPIDKCSEDSESKTDFSPFERLSSRRGLCLHWSAPGDEFKVWITQK